MLWIISRGPRCRGIVRSALHRRRAELNQCALLCVSVAYFLIGVLVP